MDCPDCRPLRLPRSDVVEWGDERGAAGGDARRGGLPDQASADRGAAQRLAARGPPASGIGECF